MTDKALSYAANLGDSDLRNKCHIFDSIIRLDGNDMNSPLNIEICKKLEQVFYAMQDSKEKALAGKAILIVGKINKEIQKIGQAYGAFDHCEPFPNIAGQLDCMDWMTLNADLRNPKNFSKCILGMDTLFKALNILMRPINESERTQLVDILEYYGFHRSTKEGIFRVYPRQKPIAASFIPKHILSGHVCDVQLLDACKWSFKFLAENGLKWKSKLEKELKNTLDECLTSSLDTLRKRVHIFVRRIELEMHIRVGSMEFERRGSIFDKELGLLKEISFSNCEHLLRDIFQDDGTISYSTLDWGQMLQFCNYLKNPEKRFFHQNLTLYLQFLVQHHCPSWRKDDVPNFLCFLFVYDIFGERLQITPAFVLKNKNNNAQTEERKSTTQKDVTKSQFELTFDDEKERMLPVSSICARISECQELLKGLKPHAALIKFGNFCETLSQCDVMLLPCVSPLLYWMEFYLTLFLFSSTALLTTPNESNPNKIFLPLSYYRNTIAMSCALTNRTDIIQNIVKSSKDSKQLKPALLKSLQSMGQLLFGTSSKLNLFDFIFSSEENKFVRAQKNAFSERLLVLCLAVFCNLRKKVDKAAEIEKELAEKIWSLVSLQKKKNVPEEMKKRLNKTKKHHLKPSDFQFMYYDFVNCKRNGENLFCFGVNCQSADVTLHEEIFNLENCRKKHFLNPETSQVEQTLLTQNSKDRESERLIDRYKKMSKACIDLSDLHVKHNIENTSQEDNPCTDKRESLVKQQEPQSKEEKAINIIVRALRKYVFRKKSLGMISKLKQLIKTKKDEEIEKSFSSQSHDQNMCRVCGIHYVRSSEFSNDNTVIYERQENRLSDVMLSYNSDCLNNLESTVNTLNDSKVDSGSSDSIDPFRLLMKRRQNIEQVQETLEAHIANEAHHSKLSQYESFRCKVNAEIYDAVNDVERFIDIYGLLNVDAAKLYPDLYPNIDLLCNNLRELVELKKQIIKEKDWGNSEIDDKVRDLLAMLSLLKEPVKQKAKENKEVKFIYIFTI